MIETRREKRSPSPASRARPHGRRRAGLEGDDAKCVSASNFDPASFEYNVLKYLGNSLFEANSIGVQF
jgi:hypothetical protein